MRTATTVTLKIPIKFYSFFLDMADAYQAAYSAKEVSSLEKEELDFLNFLESNLLKGTGTKRLNG